MVPVCGALMTTASDSVATRRDPATPAARRGALLVACAAICWSSGGLITRLVTTSPWTTSLWRSLFCVLFSPPGAGDARGPHYRRAMARRGAPGSGRRRVHGGVLDMLHPFVGPHVRGQHADPHVHRALRGRA